MGVIYVLLYRKNTVLVNQLSMTSFRARIDSLNMRWKYVLEIQHASGPKRSIIRRSKYEKLDKVLYLWFLQKRVIGTPVSGLILTAKAKIYISCMAIMILIVLSQI